MIPNRRLPTVERAHGTVASRPFDMAILPLQASHSPTDRLSERSANHSYYIVTYTSEGIVIKTLQLYQVFFQGS